MQDDYLRLIAGQLHALLLLQTARDLFGKSWPELTQPQTMAVYNAVDLLERQSSQFLTPEVAATISTPPQQDAQKQKSQPGFVAPEKKE